MKRLLSLLLGCAFFFSCTLSIAATPEERVIEKGWMTLKADHKFHGEKPVTRAELATILTKAFELDTRAQAVQVPAQIVDVPKSHWAYPAIQTVLGRDVMQGYRLGRFYPNQVVSRAEGYAIFAQAFGVYPFEENMIHEILAPYTDSHRIPAWAKKAFATALQNEFVNKTGATLQPGAPMTRRDIAYALAQYIALQERPHPSKGL